MMAKMPEHTLMMMMKLRVMVSLVVQVEPAKVEGQLKSKVQQIENENLLINLHLKIFFVCK